MNAEQTINEKLQGKSFRKDKKIYDFVKCKPVSTYVMIHTDKETLQVSLEKVTEFLNEIEIVVVEHRTEYLPAVPEKKQDVMLMPESPAIFNKLNTSFESLIDEISNASPDDLSKLESKARMLTSIGQTAVNMQNAKNGILKAISKGS